jgi:hypothetical protein
MRGGSAPSNEPSTGQAEQTAPARSRTQDIYEELFELAPDARTCSRPPVAASCTPIARPARCSTGDRPGRGTRRYGPAARAALAAPRRQRAEARGGTAARLGPGEGATPARGLPPRQEQPAGDLQFARPSGGRGPGRVHAQSPAQRRRVRSMALVYERLYRSSDLSRVEFGDYLRELARELRHSYGFPPRRSGSFSTWRTRALASTLLSPAA